MVMDRATSSVAEHIRKLLGVRACMMLKAKNFAPTVEGLQFEIKRNHRSVVRITIRLELNDTYSLRFYGRKDPTTWEMPLRAHASGILEADVLKVIEHSTGLPTSLAVL